MKSKYSQILRFSVLWLGFSASGCFWSHTIRSHQRVVSQSPYARSGPLTGPRNNKGAIRLGGTAEHAPISAKPKERPKNEGNHFVPTSRVEGHIAVQATDHFEIGLSGGSFSANSRSNAGDSPLPLRHTTLAYGGLDARYFPGDASKVSLNFGARVSALRYSFDYRDEHSCTRTDCFEGTRIGGKLDQTALMGSGYIGVGYEIPIGLKSSFALGTTLDLLPQYETKRTGEKRCRASGCKGEIPSKPPNAILGVGLDTYAGFIYGATDSMRLKLVVHPVSVGPVTHYLVTQAGIEAVF